MWIKFSHDCNLAHLKQTHKTKVEHLNQTPAHPIRKRYCFTLCAGILFDKKRNKSGNTHKSMQNTLKRRNLCQFFTSCLWGQAFCLPSDHRRQEGMWVRLDATQRRICQQEKRWNDCVCVLFLQHFEYSQIWKSRREMCLAVLNFTAVQEFSWGRQLSFSKLK